MSKSDKDTPPHTSSRPACMPSNKDDGFLPPINFRGTPSSDSDSDCRRNGQLSSNENSSLSSSPVKLPSIGRSFSTSVSSLNKGLKEKDRREIICRSPSCPSNIGLSTTKQLDFTPENKNTRRDRFEDDDDDDDLRLPSIFRDRKSSVASYVTPRNTSKTRTNSQGRSSLKSQDPNPKQTGLDKHEKYALCSKTDQVPTTTPRSENLDTHRSTTQCALLLPLRNTETRKSKRKRRNGHYRQNTQLSTKSESAACDDVNTKDVIIPSSRSEYNGYSPVRELDASRILSESDDLHSDISSEGNPVHPSYHVNKHSNKHQMRMKDMAHVKA
ncbi:hypothetical protein SNE40_010248 [Patella caerulea]|uniref:Uncharacterized protein n=1 Tax=Patella caerulea TaxID=87958 RepID=A0AAN8JVK7_PATCE